MAHQQSHKQPVVLPGKASPSGVAPVAVASAPVKSWASLAKVAPTTSTSPTTSAPAAPPAATTPPTTAAKSTNTATATATTNPKPHGASPPAPASAAASSAAAPPQQQHKQSPQQQQQRVVQKKHKNGAAPEKNGHDSHPPAVNGASSASPLLPSASLSSGSPAGPSASPGPASASSASPSAIHTPPMGGAGSNPNSQPGSQQNTPGRKGSRKIRNAQQQQGGGGGHTNQQQHPHQHQQQQPAHNPQAPHQQMLFQPGGFVGGYPGQQLLYPGGGPFPVPLGPGGLPLANYSPMMPGGYVQQQFPMYAMPGGMPFMPQPPLQQQQQQPQQLPGNGQPGHGKQQRQPQQFQGQQPQGTFQPGFFTPPSASGSGSSTPAASTPTAAAAAAAAAGSAPGSAQGFRGQPYSNYFLQQQAAAFQMAAYPMAASMAAMNLGGGAMGAPYAPMTAGGPPGQAFAGAMTGGDATAATSAAGNNLAIQGQLPAFPSPFAAPPFAALVATAQLPISSAPYYSVDVECVATGRGHNDRALAHVAVVDQHGQIVLNLYIHPSKPIVSYLPALTGLSEKDLAQGITEEEAISLFRATIPPSAILVGQNILKDVEWLHLVEGEDFAGLLDLAGLFACKNPQFRSLTFFSLAHEAKALLALDQTEMHHPAIDAWLSIKLYELYQLLQHHPAELERSKQLLLDLKVESAFSKRNPEYDGVCMGSGFAGGFTPCSGYDTCPLRKATKPVRPTK